MNHSLQSLLYGLRAKSKDSDKKQERPNSIGKLLSYIHLPNSTSNLNKKSYQTLKFDSTPRKPNTYLFGNHLPSNFVEDEEQSLRKSKNFKENTKNLRQNRNEYTTHFYNQKLKEKLNLPASSFSIIKNFSHLLTETEKNEILEYSKSNRKPYAQNELGEYLTQQGEHVAYRYEIIDLIGVGCFGQVFKVIDHKTNLSLALKMIRNDHKLRKQGLVEEEILKYINERDSQGTSNIVKIMDSFIFRGHQCFVFELLEKSLFDIIRERGYQGLDLIQVKEFSFQILIALNFLREQRIVHCDIKPENILLSGRTVKIVDFGSSCFHGKQIYTYIQSRYYRAPEVIVGSAYGPEIDIWSFACLIPELITGNPLFPGRNEEEQLKLYVEILGLPPKEIIMPGQRTNIYFTQDGKLKVPYKECDFPSGLEQDLQDLLRKCLQWDPKKRIIPADALEHPWIQKNLPDNLRQEHLKYIQQIKSQKIYQLQQNVLSISPRRNKDKDLQNQFQSNKVSSFIWDLNKSSSKSQIKGLRSSSKKSIQDSMECEKISFLNPKIKPYQLC